MQQHRESPLPALVVIAALCAISAVPAACNKTVESKKSALPPEIKGHRVGITVAEVKRQLREMSVKNYETGFSDLIVYDPSPGTEIKLLLTCSADGPVVARVERSNRIPEGENDPGLMRIQDELLAEYGTPTIAESRGGGLDLCWGQCVAGADGSTIAARITSQGKKKGAMALSISNNALIQACARLRPKKINAWLYQWIAAIQKFKPGMSLQEASALYKKRYQNQLIADEQQDEAFPQAPVTYYVVNDYDFFSALDYEAQSFEGEGPGTIILKFTGDHADKDSILNRKLYTMSFSTTNFTDQHSYVDVKQKLDAFIKVYGPPVEIIQQPDGIAARWQKDTEQRSVNIFDSGLISFEQSDQAIKDAYREAALKKANTYASAGFYQREDQGGTEQTVFPRITMQREQDLLGRR